jgi:hypothetical protein
MILSAVTSGRLGLRITPPALIDFHQGNRSFLHEFSALSHLLFLTKPFSQDCTIASAMTIDKLLSQLCTKFSRNIPIFTPLTTTAHVAYGYQATRQNTTCFGKSFAKATAEGCGVRYRIGIVLADSFKKCSDHGLCAMITSAKIACRLLSCLLLIHYVSHFLNPIFY